MKKLPKAARAPEPFNFHINRGARIADVLAHRNPCAEPYQPKTIKPTTSREFLKGLAKLRRAIVNPPKDDMELVPDARVMDTWGDRMKGDFVVYKRKSQCPLKSLPKLGSGCFATVYALDEHRAIKVVTGTEYNYSRFVDLALQNQHNPHFPKIYYRGQWGDKKIYVMERLTDDHHDTREYFCAAANSVVYKTDNPFLTPVSITDPHMQEAVSLLKEHGLTGDIYTKNVLARKDGTIVITDPIGG